MSSGNLTTHRGPLADASLFDLDLATFNKNPKFNQNSSASFIEIYGLGMKTAHQVKG